MDPTETERMLTELYEALGLPTYDIASMPWPGTPDELAGLQEQYERTVVHPVDFTEDGKEIIDTTGYTIL